MARQNRATLKKYFKDGAMPSAAQFSELIDSGLNMQDEGFFKSVNYGFEIVTQGSSPSLVSFFRDDQPLVPWWSIQFDDTDKKKLVFRYMSAEPSSDESSEGYQDISADKTGASLLTLDPKGRLGILNDEPEHEVDVRGTIRCVSRQGVVPLRELTDNEVTMPEEKGKIVDQSRPVIADGKWHNITPELSGCRAFNVVAGVGVEGTGRYALLQSVALNAYCPRGWLFNFLGIKNGIKTNQSYYRKRIDKLALRWHGDEHRYFLQIKTNGDYRTDPQGNPIRIKYHLTDLWSDPRMVQSWGEQKE